MYHLIYDLLALLRINSQHLWFLRLIFIFNVFKIYLVFLAGFSHYLLEIGNVPIYRLVSKLPLLMEVTLASLEV